MLIVDKLILISDFRFQISDLGIEMLKLLDLYFNVGFVF